MLMQEAVLALLPVAAASGWMAARKHYTRKYLTDYARPLTRAYRLGLNYLLDEKTEKAIATVSQILEQDYEPLETHIALGNLFRRRGEVDRAIEIHEKLLHEPSLSEAHKERCRYELGMDYMSAGLHDRAESILQSLGRSKSYGRLALQQLLVLYQQERDWRNAIDCVKRLEGVAKPLRGESVAHFLCEMAEDAMSLHRLKDARDLLGQALREDPACVRASIAKAKLEQGNGEYLQAVETLMRIEAQNPRYLPVVLPMLQACWQRQGNEQDLFEYLGHLYRDLDVVAAAVAAALLLRESRGVSAALDYLLPVMESHPDASAIGKALEWLGEDRNPGADRLKRLADVMKEYLSGQSVYHCEECGFHGSELHWRCPSCQSWDSMIPA